jgi:Tol biopolymer transport system component
MPVRLALFESGQVTRVVAALLAVTTFGCAGSSSRPDGLTGAIAFVGPGNRVLTVDATDSKVTRIGRRSVSGGPDWSPDGTTLAYSTPDSLIVIANASGEGERSLGRKGCYGPIFSPDGHRLACENTEPNVVTVIDVDDGGLVARTPDCCYRPTWSPDGRKIAYSSFGTYKPKTGLYVGPDGLFVMDVDGSNMRLVAKKSVADNTPPAWSSRGRIAFVSDDDGGIWTVSASGAALRRIVSADAHPQRRLAWSPDGTKLTFEGGDGDFEVFVVNADGSGLSNLTDNERIQDEWPSWSPDGKAIAFVSNQDEGLNQIFAMRVDGSGLTQLTSDSGGGACCPVWSAAG